MRLTGQCSSNEHALHVKPLSDPAHAPARCCPAPHAALLHGSHSVPSNGWHVTGAHWLAPHASHGEHDTAPVSLAYVPLAHGVQLAAPRTELAVPVGQRRHWLALLAPVRG